MKKALKHTISGLQIFLIAAMLSTSFIATKGFFNDLIISKQYGLETVCLYTGFLFVITLLFQKQILFTKIDLLILLFGIWYVIIEFFTDSNYTPISEILFSLLLWGLVYVFVRQASGNPLFVWGVAIVWMIVVLLQSALGLLQLYGLESSYHGLFNITGTFHNPGPFSGFVVSGLPIALGVVGYSEFSKEKGYTELNGEHTEDYRGICLKLMKINISFSSIIRYSILALAWIILMAILLVLPPAQSRAAWMAGIAGSVFVLAGHPALLSFKDGFKKKFLTLKRPLRFLILIVVLSSIAAVGFGLYSIKKGSADGRILIWLVTSQLIKQSPVTGYGTGAFNALYMNEQANWFASGKGSEAQTMVAGTPEAPFNEPQKLWLEKGFIAILLAGAILFFIFVNNIKAVNYKPIPILGTSLRYATLNPKQTTFFKGALISLLVFSLFSYPFDISSLILQLVILVAILSGTSKAALQFRGKKSLLVSIPVSMVLVLAIIHFIPQRQSRYIAMKIWQEADHFYSFGSYHTAVDAYEEAFPVLENEGLFLQMYGKALNMNEQYQKSNQILEMAQSRISNQIIQNAMGDNYKALGNYHAAEIAYEMSKHMIPSLLLPKYLMAKLFYESGQNQKAQKAAEELLNSPIKVKSSATREIMREMKEIINDQLPVNNDCY